VTFQNSRSVPSSDVMSITVCICWNSIHFISRYCMDNGSYETLNVVLYESDGVICEELRMIKTNKVTSCLKTCFMVQSCCRFTVLSTCENAVF
jgi:hypothetical protein